MLNQQKFNKVLQSAKKALDSIEVPFHLHSGTALGSQREHTFIPHDTDIDIAVFYSDVNTRAKYVQLIKAMEKVGFKVLRTFGSIERGKEVQLIKNNVPFDIFWVYNAVYKRKPHFVLASYLGECNKYPQKRCAFAYRPYVPEEIEFMGQTYLTLPTATLEDVYGKSWRTPREFGYFTGVEENLYGGKIKDFNWETGLRLKKKGSASPSPPLNRKKAKVEKLVDTKIAFCFIVYDKLRHQKIWEDFFAQDDSYDHTYSIYSHVKQITDKTPGWIKDAKIDTIKTEYCDESLVLVWVKLLREALKDPLNKYFCNLSGECIPLRTYKKTFQIITRSSRSRVAISHIEDEQEKVYMGSQWMILNRETAEMLIALYDTEEGKNFREHVTSLFMEEDDTDDEEDIGTEDESLLKTKMFLCPDEVFPISWFVYKYGTPSNKNFKHLIMNAPSTYIRWNYRAGKPYIFTKPQLKHWKRKICTDKHAVFGRKFTRPAASVIAMKCD